jgi:hypothetical protein
MTIMRSSVNVYFRVKNTHTDGTFLLLLQDQNIPNVAIRIFQCSPVHDLLFLTCLAPNIKLLMALQSQKSCNDPGRKDETKA